MSTTRYTVHPSADIGFCVVDTTTGNLAEYADGYGPVDVLLSGYAEQAARILDAGGALAPFGLRASAAYRYGQ